jgi:hypothetical protein
VEKYILEFLNFYALAEVGNQIKENEMGGICSTNGEKCRLILVGNLKQRKHLKDRDGAIILNFILYKESVRLKTEFKWFRTGPSGGLF